MLNPSLYQIYLMPHLLKTGLVCADRNPRLSSKSTSVSIPVPLYVRTYTAAYISKLSSKFYRTYYLICKLLKMNPFTVNCMPNPSISFLYLHQIYLINPIYSVLYYYTCYDRCKYVRTHNVSTDTNNWRAESTDIYITRYGDKYTHAPIHILSVRHFSSDRRGVNNKPLS